jgi:hypothetical protein
MMENVGALSTLRSLAQLDIDASCAYRHAIAAIDIPDICRELIWAWRDHERHIESLGEEIRRLGGEPPDKGRDLKGIALEGITALRSGFGALSALRAMRMNELLTNARYEAALREDLPESVRAIVARNRTDERRHLDFIEYALATRERELAAQEATLFGIPAAKLLLGVGVLLTGLGLAWGLRAWSAAPASPARREHRPARHIAGRAHHWTTRHEVGARQAGA